MFGKKQQVVDVRSFENMVWLCDKTDSKRRPGQLMDEEFYETWLDSMYRAFHLLGMLDRYRQFTQEVKEMTGRTREIPRGFISVKGWRNRHSLRKAMENVQKAVPEFRLVPVQGGKVLEFTGKRRDVLLEWQGITELLMKTTVAAIATQALSYYVDGSQVGYSPETRRLFKRGNTVKRLGTRYEPMWELTISGYTVLLGCPWEKAADTQRETGYSILQQFQLAINDGLEQALKREG